VHVDKGWSEGGEEDTCHRGNDHEQTADEYQKKAIETPSQAIESCLDTYETLIHKIETLCQPRLQARDIGPDDGEVGPGCYLGWVISRQVCHQRLRPLGTKQFGETSVEVGAGQPQTWVSSMPSRT
jgi:hypothetical protein